MAQVLDYEQDRLYSILVIWVYKKRVISFRIAFLLSKIRFTVRKVYSYSCIEEIQLNRYNGDMALLPLFRL